MSTINLSLYPERINRIAIEYEQMTNSSIEFVELDNIPYGGNAPGRLTLSDCKARVEYRSDLNEHEMFKTICHEMLHLELSLRGYPLLEYMVTDSNARDLVAHLESVLQHSIIMPIEATEFGYNPYQIENKVSEKIWQAISSTPIYGDKDDILWKFIYSLFGVGYCRVMVLADDGEIKERISHLFTKPELELSVAIGNSLLNIVNKSDLSGSKKYIEIANYILTDIIKGNILYDEKRIILGKPCFLL
jgi:hypothetical protein